MNRVSVLCVVGLVLAGCGGGDKQGEAQKTLEAVLREEEARTQALAADVEQLKARLREAESARATERHHLEELQKRLAESWRGDAHGLETELEAARVPAALRPALEAAQKAMGGDAPEQLFSQGLAHNDLSLVSSALTQWASREGVTPAPDAEAPEAPAKKEERACTRVTGDFKCAPLPLEGSGDGMTQLCRLSDGTGNAWAWVVRSEHGRVVHPQLVPGSHDRYRAVRTLGPDVWLLRGDSGWGESGPLEVFEVSGTQAVRRHEVTMLGESKLVEADLDKDDLPEVLVVSSAEVQAVHRAGLSGAVSLWREADICPRLEGRSEKELEAVRAACSSWRQRSQPPDAGAQ
ncbi:MAG: hypothetical protein ACXU86_20430 [Archangium sp.]